MLSKAKMYAECEATASPPNQRRHPSNLPKPSAFRLLLLEISEHLGEKDVKNFKALVEDYGHTDDKGALTAEQLQGVTTTFSLLMESVKVGFIQPDNLSNLVAFLDISGHGALAQEIEDFQKKEQNSTSPAIHGQVQARVNDEAHQGSMEPSGLSDHLQCVDSSPLHSGLHATTNKQPGDEHSKQRSDPSLQAEAKPEQPTDDEGQLGVAPLGVSRQQQKIIPYSLAVVQVNIPIKLQDALKGIVIGHYVDVFRCIYSHFENVIKRYTRVFWGPFTEFNDGDGITFELGLGTVQHLPIQALNHPPFRHSEDYECILQLIMEAILIAPNPEKNLAMFLKFPNLQVPESLQLLYRSRLPSVATDKELQDELASQSSRLADWLRGEQQQTNFAASKNTLYLAQAYDATAHVNRHQMKADFRSVFMQKADFHERAMEERQNYEPRTDLEKAILKLESTRSAQSQGYAYAEMATNGPERPVVRREHAEKARALHEEAINEHATPLLEMLHMHQGMSEGAALVANLRFDEMLRNLRPAQLDYILHHAEWSEEVRQRKLQHHLALVVNEFDRIHYQLSSRTLVIPVLQDLLAKMEESVVPLKEDVANGHIKGFALNDPTMSE